jgi:hypothetical protein
MLSRNFGRATLGIAGLLALSACCHIGTPATRGEIEAPTSVTITQNPDGSFNFDYDSRFADRAGNFDFTEPPARGNQVALEFTIDPASTPGLRFEPEGRDAIFIAMEERSRYKDDAGDVAPRAQRYSVPTVGYGQSPQEPYRGDQFFDFRVTNDGRTLLVTDRNDDGMTYRYSLRFRLNGESVVHDPRISNGKIN